MKTKHLISAAIILTGVFSAVGADYSQNFDSMGTSGTAAPTGWSLRTITGESLNAAIPTSVDMASTVAGSATLQVWNQTDAAVEWTDQAGNEGANANDSNRMLGTSPTATRGSMIQFSLPNTFGKTITSVTLSYDLRSAAAGVLKAGFDPGSLDELPGFSFYFLDGSTWTHFSGLDLASAGTASATFSYTSPVANGGTLQFRWFDDNAYAYSPDAMPAIDNVNITVPEPGTLSLMALGALALVSLRRKV